MSLDMEGNVMVPSPSMSTESSIMSQIMEEGPRLCPICSSAVKLFFINLNEKLLLCEDFQCEFPFGYEDLVLVEVAQGEEMNDTVSVKSSSLVSTASSMASSTFSSEIEKLVRVNETDVSHFEPRITVPTRNPRKVHKKVISNRESEIQIKKNVKSLKELTMELNDLDSPRKTIKNEKWIKNLMFLQDKSGCKLLKPEELKNLNKTEEVKPELRIDIAPGTSGGVSSIKIEIAKQNPGASQS